METKGKDDVGCVTHFQTFLGYLTIFNFLLGRLCI